MNEELTAIHKNILPQIEARLAEFREVWKNGSEEDLFFEMAFCLFTPQSSSRGCYEAALRLKDAGLLVSCSNPATLQKQMKGVRFHITKSSRLIELRESLTAHGKLNVRQLFDAGDPMELRDRLVGKVKGYGCKEASHLLRNLGFGEHFAILDRHILRAMVDFGIVDKIPDTLNRARYLALEAKLKDFSDSIGIPFAHFDFVLWYRVNGKCSVNNILIDWDYTLR
jgi:N-glycosylase/DNA lyase